VLSVCVDKSSMVSGKKSYWNYMSDCLAGNKYLKDGLHFVRSLTEVCVLFTVSLCVYVAAIIHYVVVF